MKTAEILSPAETRNFIINHVEYVESRTDFGPPTSEEIDTFSEIMDQNLAIAEYKTNRGIREISADLDLNVSQAEAMFMGKSVLDIGCGAGVLSSQISRLKRTRVTALDIDPEKIAKISSRKNLTPVIGSAYNLPEALGDGKFQIVVSAFSGHHWVKSPDKKVTAIMSALDACEPGGKVLLIPLLSNVAHATENRKALDRGRDRNGVKLSEEKLEQVKRFMRVYDWIDVLSVDTLLEQEEAGRIDCTFVSSRDNKLRIPVLNALRGEDDPAQDRYSAIIEVLAS